MDLKKLTILHSNDMHGDFLAEVRGEEGKLIGGLALLSGYINKVRKEEENTLFLISGDMVQGSVIDSEYKGVSTMEIMNFLAPDVATLGNHEFDYGLPHLLFLERMANFPIVNANLYIKKYNKRLMKSHIVINKNGINILFIGIITEKVIDSIIKDKDVGSFITLEEASKEVGKIINAYKDEDIDLTVLLTHIGFESDIELAKLLDPLWGIDIIIGGHSHTILSKPEVVNNILITQAGVGTDQIGRFDLAIDKDRNSIYDYNWKLIPIDDKIAQKDLELENYINSYKEVVDRKYNTIITRFSEKLTHPQREVETSLGNLVADVFQKRASCDVVLIGSGSIRLKELGEIVTLGSFLSCFPYDEVMTKFIITGEKLKRIFKHIMRPENRTGEGECYEVNQKVKAVYDEKRKELESLCIDKKLVLDSQKYSILIPGYHLANSKTYLDLTREELEEISGSKVVITSFQSVLEEFLRENQNLKSKVEGRLIYKNS